MGTIDMERDKIASLTSQDGGRASQRAALRVFHFDSPLVSLTARLSLLPSLFDS